MSLDVWAGGCLVVVVVEEEEDRMLGCHLGCLDGTDGAT